MSGELPSVKVLGYVICDTVGAVYAANDDVEMFRDEDLVISEGEVVCAVVSADELEALATRLELADQDRQRVQAVEAVVAEWTPYESHGAVNVPKLLHQIRAALTVPEAQTEAAL